MFTILFTIIIVGLILYLVNSFVPMEPRIKSILNIVVIILLLLWLGGALFGYRFPR